MNINTLPQIAPRYLERSCILYTVTHPSQVIKNTGSSLIQWALDRVALAMGWSASALEVITGEQGAPARPDWDLVMRRLSAGTVGALITTSLQRAVPGPTEAFRLFSLCRTVDTLVIDSTQVISPDAVLPWLDLLQVMMAQMDSNRRTEYSMRAAREKARLGYAVSAPPGGYEAVGGGQWIQDRDPVVRHGYSAVFSLYLALHSLGKVARYFEEYRIALLRRVRGMLVPTAITPQRIHRILRNPAYQGDYLFGVAPTTARLAHNRTGSLRPAWATPVYIPGHHPPYVSPADFDRIQALLRRNRTR
jgi:DNA invertase Pin-like site-specific DNA recombinase